MAGIQIEIGLYVAVPIALLGAGLVYRDARRRGMDTADMWAVGFFVAFFLLPVIGGLVVLALYFRNGSGGGGSPYPSLEQGDR